MYKFYKNGVELHEGDTIWMERTPKFLYLGSDGKLGIDATNPKWIDSGRATPCEWGIYPIDTFDLNELGIVMVTI